MYREHERFYLRKQLPGESIPVGTIGVVLIVFEDGQAYEVEFVNQAGRNLGSSPTFTISEEFMESIAEQRASGAGPGR